MSKSKVKGKRFEDNIAYIIHQFLLNEFDDYKKMLLEINPSLKVKRNFNSGSTVNDDGDIDLNFGKKYFPFSIECKFWKNLTDLNIFNFNKIKILEKIYRKQALPTSKKKNLIPIVIFKANRTKPMVFFDNTLLNFNINDINYYIKDNMFYTCFLDNFLNITAKKFREGNK